MPLPAPLGPRAAKASAPRRTFTPKYQKPLVGHCAGCPLETRGAGFVPAYVPPVASPILLVGEAPWYDEVAMGTPMAGAAGSMLTRVLRLAGKTREQAGIDNLIRCAVPEMAIEKWPGAVAQCQYVDQHIREQQPRVIVPMGGAALRRLLQLPRGKNTKVENFHGTVTWSATHDAWIVPTYHPSHLQRGAVNLMGVVAFDLQRAWEVAADGWPADPAVTVIDPPLDWFTAWADQAIAAMRSDPFAYPLATDIETPDKGADEGEILATGPDHSYQITRVNLSIHPDEGITVPADPAYFAVLQRIFAAEGLLYFWFKGFDLPRLVAAGMPIRPDRAWDVMWMAKAVQSDLPLGLGFHAPFHSRYGAWKHLAETAPGQYAAVDGFQTRRVGDGYVADLTATGQWHVFLRHMDQFHRTVLQPATEIGVAIDRTRLETFKTKLDAECTRLLGVIAAACTPDLRLRTPKEGLTRPPLAGTLHPKATAEKRDGTAKKAAPDPIKAQLYATARVVEALVLREGLVCETCGMTDRVTRTHRCQTPKGTPPREPRLVKQVRTVTRWFWEEPFNPDSPSQLMAYAKAKGHTPGKSKQTGHDSMDRETLSRLIRETGDPIYEGTLAYRAVQKVRGTYVLGTLARLDPEDRLHGTFGFKPSTMRLNGTNPNLHNVVADKGGKDSLAAGFRHCVVARGRWVEAGSGWEDV